MDITLIIPVHSNEDSIGNLLSSLSDMSLDKIDAEIIFVADQCRQKTILQLEQWCITSENFGYIQAFCFQSSFLNPDAARDMAMKYAGGSCIAFIDDDCTPSPEWLEKAFLNSTQFGAATGRVRHRNSIMGSVCAIADFGEFQGDVPTILFNAPGCNVAFKKQLSGNGQHKYLHSKNTLEEKISLNIYPIFEDAPFSGDRILSYRLSKIFGGIYYDPGMEVLHEPLLTFSALIKRQIRYGKVAWQVRYHLPTIKWGWILQSGYFAPFVLTAGRWLIDLRRTLFMKKLSPTFKLAIVLMLFPLRLSYLHGALRACIHYRKKYCRNAV